MKVLIADDDHLTREMLRVVLRDAGYEVVLAADGREARDVLEKEHIRMLVVDWMMPGLDGPGLIRHVRSAGWPKYTYIILLTAKAGRDEIVEGLNLGADDYVTKPFRREELLARMGVGSRILDLEARLSESLAREAAQGGRDGLTGLLNRRALQERAQAELNRAARERRSVGVVMLDLDHFKAINDRFGHAAGDEALRKVAEVLERSPRDYDLSGRWGGEEFLVVLPGATLAQACVVADRIRSAIEEVALDVGQREPLLLRASLGVVAAPPSAQAVPLEEIVKQADEALYRAKATGRNRVCWQPVAAEA